MNRKDVDEPRWQTINDHMHARDTDQWKEGEAGRSTAGADTTEEKQDDSWRSKSFERLTKTKVYAAFGNMLETIMPDGKVPFGLEDDPDSGTVPPPPSDEDRLMGVEQGYKLMEKKLRRQHLDGKADRAFMRVLLSMAEYGEGNLKGPILKKVKKVFWTKVQVTPEELGLPPGTDPLQAGVPEADLFRHEQQEREELIPTFEYVSVWDIFKDHEVDDQQTGRGIIHRTFISPDELALKIDQPFYDNDAIDVVLEQNKQNMDHQHQDNSFSDESTTQPERRGLSVRDKHIQQFEFWGKIPLEKWQDWEEKQESPEGEDEVDLEMSSDFDDEDDFEMVEVIAVIAGGRTVKMLKNPFGKRLIYNAQFELQLDDSSGNGVGDNLIDAQRDINSTIRAIRDNAALSGNVILFTKPYSTANNKPVSIKPGAVNELSDEVDRASDALQQVQIGKTSSELLELLEIQKISADEASQIPRSISGEPTVGKKPNTAFEVNELVSQAGKYIGLAIRNFDEGIIEPAIEQQYHWNMLQPEFDESKGSYVINATGFKTFQSEVVRKEKIFEFYNLVANDPGMAQFYSKQKFGNGLAKSIGLRPEEFAITEQEQQQATESQVQAVWDQVGAVLGMDGQQLQATVAEREKEQQQQQLDDPFGQQAAAEGEVPQEGQELPPEEVSMEELPIEEQQVMQ